MGLFGISIGDKNLFKGRNDVKRLGEKGEADYAYGGGLLEEGIGGLRKLRSIYEGRIDDPLGPQGRSIFARARGAASDAYARSTNAGMARRRQLATQSGGALTPEQIAALDAEDRRGASENLFGAERDIAISEAETTLSEASKFFDRLEGISRTIGAVGSEEKARGLASILSNLNMRASRDAQKRSLLGGIAGSIISPFASRLAQKYIPVGGGEEESSNPWGFD